MKILSRLPLLSLILLLVLTVNCRRTLPTEIVQSSYNARISAFSTGYIPVTGYFMVEFSDTVKGIQPGRQASSSLATISPKINGSWQWTDHRTLRFTPSSPLPPGKEWQIAIHLSKLFPEQSKDFLFGVFTLPQNYRVQTQHLQMASANDFDNYKLAGQLTLANDISAAEAKKILQAKLNGTNIPIVWQHVSGTIHNFEINPIPRTEVKGLLQIIHSGKHIDSKDEGKIEFSIPALGDFSIQQIEVVQQPKQMIRVSFSAPLLEAQNLDGLFSLSGDVPFNWILGQNTVELFPVRDIYGDFELSVMPGIKDNQGQQFENVLRKQIHFSSLNPAVEFIGEGTILPFSGNLMVHFRAVSLKSVLLRIIKIYESNVPAFLQINTMDENYQIKRAGRLVHHSIVSLEEDVTLDLNSWNAYALELSKLIEPEPGAIYRIELGFDRSFSVFPCDEGHPTEASELLAVDLNFWDDSEDYFSSYPYIYQPWDWENRDNPCSDSYYRRSRWAAKNILASNLGIIAKSGSTDQITVAVTDLRNTLPLQDVNLEILNFQMKPMANGKTGVDGKAELNIQGKEQPFLLIASKGSEKGYLKLDQGHMLPLSRFDVAGQAVQEGIKGFIYGERGVWRPGDSIFISFMVEDKNHKMPENHPVTFELLNPHGQIMHQEIKHHPNNRIYSFRCSTNEDALTGQWLARISFGDAVFEKNIRIETIKPNRLRINLDFKDEVLTAEKENIAELMSEWLYGAPAAGLRAQVTLSLEALTTKFEKYPGFIFDDELKKFEAEESVAFDGKLDETGKTRFSLRYDKQQAAPGLLKARFTTRVFEKGGSYSIDAFSLPLSIYKRFIGIRVPQSEKNTILETDKDYDVEIITLDTYGNKLSVSNLKYKIFKVNWRWWWDRSDENLARYVSSGSATLIDEGQISSINGIASLPFKIKHPEWGRYLIQVKDPNENGHSTSTTVMVDWPGWMQRSTGFDADAASILVFSADKERYEVGEIATLTFPSGQKGRTLISIENGSKIIDSWWIEPQTETTSFSFKITDEMTPNCYVHISYLQPHQDRGNDLPIRLYGILPIEVWNTKTLLEPVIESKDEWLPGKTAEIRISEKNKKEMSYTIAVVDDGLLDLTRFRTPSPWNYFNAREALGVKTWDMYDYVLGAFGGRIERVFGIGGDDELISYGSINQIRRFEPMVNFIGPFDLNRRSSNLHKINIPDYSGSVRIMVIATTGEAFGSAEKNVKIRQPLMVWAGLPGVLGPEENILLPVTIFASDKALGDIKVSVKTGNNLFCTEGNEQIVRIKSEGEKTIFFKLKTGTDIGFSKVEVTAISGKETGTHTINIPVRNPHPPVTVVKSELVPAGKEKTISYNLPGTMGTNNSILEISAIPPIDFSERLNSLVRYSHNSLEQIVSKAFPQLFIPELMDADPQIISESQIAVQEALNKISKYQFLNGGLSYWPGANHVDEWLSNYTGHFMLEAEQKGFAISGTLKRNWLSYQKKQSASWVPDRSGYYPASAYIQAYRLYTLALAGQADFGGMNRLRQQENMIAGARWRLAAAYALAGVYDAAREIIDGISETAELSSAFQYTYGSEERDKAMVMETLLLLNERERASRIALELAEKLNSKQWMSSHTTAFVLVSLSNYFKGDKNISDEVKVKYKTNKDKEVNVHFSKALWKTTLNLEDNKEGTLSLKNNSDKEVFVNLIMTGQPAHELNEKAISNNMIMQVDYNDLDNQAVDIEELQQGDDFKLTVTVMNPGPVKISNLVLTKIFPSGWENRNMRLEEGGAVHQIDHPDYQDIRDDRVYSYFDLNPGEIKKFVILLHASYAGEFILPAISCEAMYDYSVRALIPGRKVRVRSLDIY